MSVNRKISKRDIDKALIDKFTRSLEITENISMSFINLINLIRNPNLINEISKKLTIENKNHLLDIIYQSKQTSSINLASSNAMTLLNFSDYAFKDLDFSSIKIPYANLSFSQFINTSFENSDLSSTNFNRSHLYNCNFKGSDLSNTNFGIFNLEGIDLDVINQLHYVDNGDLLVAGSNDKGSSLEVGNSKRLVFAGSCGNGTTPILRFSKKYLALAGRDFKVIVGELINFSLIFEFFNDQKQFQEIAFSPCDGFIASCSSDKNIYVHEIISKTLTHVLTIGLTIIKGMTWSPCSNYLAIGNELVFLTIGDLKTRSFLYKIENKSIKLNSITGVKNFLITVYDFKSILIGNFKLKENSCLIVADYQDIKILSSSNHGTYLASSSNENYTKIGDISKQKVITKFCEKGKVTKMIFHSDDKYLISGAENLKLKKLEISMDYTKEMTKNILPILTVAFSPHNDIFASGSADFTIKLGDVNNLICINRLKYHENSVRTLRFTPCGDYLASGDGSGLIVVYDIYRNEIFMKISELNCPLISISFSSDGKSLAANTANGCVHIYELEFKNLRTIINANKDLLSSIEFAHNNSILATRNYFGVLKLLDKNSGTEIIRFDKNGYDSGAISWSHDDKYIATSCDAGHIAIYDIETGLICKQLVNNTIDIGTLKFAKNKRFLASACNDGTIKIWDVENECVLKEMHSTKGKIMEFDGDVDSNLLIAASLDGSLRLWNFN